MKKGLFVVVILVFAGVTASLLVTNTGITNNFRRSSNNFDLASAQGQLSRIIESSYFGSRFDHVEVEIDQCELKFTRYDSNACEAGATLSGSTLWLDLRHFEVNKTARRNSNENTNEIVHITVVPIDSMSERLVEADQRLGGALDLARTQVGWGSQAAKLASDTFLTENNISQIPGYRYTNSCDVGLYLGIDGGGYSFSIYEKDYSEFYRHFNSLNRHCSSQ